jgi:hypothetical protein
MALNIAGFVKKLLPSFSKSDLETDLEISLESISTINDIYTSLEEVFKVAPPASKEAKEVIKDFYKEIGTAKHKVKLSPQRNIASDTLTLFKNIKTNGEYISKEISDAINDIVISQALTAYKANLMRAVGHYYFMTKFALDLTNFFYICDAENSKMDMNKEYTINKKQREFITKNIWIYARMVALYGESHDTFKARLGDINEVMLPKEEVDNAVEFYSADKIDIFDNLPVGFIGSPIYSIRLVFATWEADRYRKLKDQKKLLELRYLHMKLMKEQGSSDVNLEKEIEHLQQRITDLDYKISKIEESVDD